LARIILSFLLMVPTSFLVKGSKPKSVINEPIRWDSFNSKEIISKARLIYMDFLSKETMIDQARGVVLNSNTGNGTVVTGETSLLPNEHYLPLEYLGYKKTKRIYHKSNS